MSEAGYVERPVLAWLSGHGAKAGDPDPLGWTYRDAATMEQYNRPDTDPFVEVLLVAALKRINPAVVKTDAQAEIIVQALRKILALPDRLEANRTMLALLRDGVTAVLEPGQPAQTVKVIEFDPAKQQLNDFTATNQYKVKGIKGVKADTILLVNGLPLVVAEFKNYTTSGDWMDGHKQLHRYQREAPALLVSNVFCVASDDQEFRYGAVLFNDATDDEIKLQRDHWRPWLSQYPTKRMYWNLPESEQDEDAVRAATYGLLRISPCNLLDFLQHFVVFETKKGKTVKKVARYQQFEAANDIVDRCIERVGKAGVDKQDRTGLIWHTQGSGKSLTMIYAANKLRRHPKLANPTVMIVVDRRDLKTQVADDFDSCDYDGVVKAMGVEDLKGKIRGDKRETVITTVQSFQQMDDMPPNARDNTVLLIDEAHRSQKGKGAGYAMTMRAKLPNSFRFGLTGTPIDRTMVNTHRDFGPVEDGTQERYLSYYGIRQAIKDGATVEVAYHFRKIPFEVDEHPLNIGFEDMAEEMEVDDEEVKDFLQRRETKWKALTRDPRRVKKVIDNMVEHFLQHPDPSGFKAQLVTIDRLACVAYKDALDAALKERGLPPEWSEVIISEAQNDPPELVRYHYTKEKSDELIDYFKLTPKEWEKANTEKFGTDRAKWRPPLKILIVCDRLLTGFDAPIEQVMYLDKPLRDHSLLQAMARTNRPFPEMGKRNGVIIDYFGVFEDMQKALNFDEKVVEEALIDWEALRKLIPDEVAACLKFLDGIKIEDTRDCLLACLRRLKDADVAHAFETQFKRTEILWEALSPDDCLYVFRREYTWLCGIYIAHRRRKSGSKVTVEELAAKTRALIQEHTTFLEIAQDFPVYNIDADYLTKVDDLPTPADRAAELEAALTRVLVEGANTFQYRKLGDRLKTLKEKKDASDEDSIHKLAELQKLVGEVVETESEPQRLGLTAPGEHELYTVIRNFAVGGDESLHASAAKAFIVRLKSVMPAGWADTVGGRKKVGLTLQSECWLPQFEALNLCPLDEENPPFLQAAVEELAQCLS
jgi:type I restriction enzyme, R subunit